MKVLVYSPSPLNSNALISLLSSLGYVGTREAGSGEELALFDLYGGRHPTPASVPTLAMVSEREKGLAELLRMGYRGLIKADEGPQTLGKALQALRCGEVWAERWVVAEALAPEGGHQLTPRERKVLNLLTQGLSNKKIAQQLGISEKTVKVYLSKLYPKLGAKNRIDIILQHIRKRSYLGI